MNAPAPEAENEYSKGPGTLRGRARRPAARNRALAAGALGGAILLVVAELTPLYTVHVSTYGSVARSVSAGSHNAYSLVPIALLAALLGLGAARAGRAAAAALGALGLLALLISLVRDLPDTSAHGITAGLAFAGTTLGVGMYLETLGAIVLLATGGVGLLAAGSRRQTDAGRGRGDALTAR